MHKSCTTPPPGAPAAGPAIPASPPPWRTAPARSPAAPTPPAMIEPALGGQGGTVRTPAEVSMSRTKTNGNSAAAADQIRQLARQAAEAAKPVAAQVKPLASDARQAAGRGVYRARAWAAPQVDRTGRVLQETVAPKVAGALQSSAQRLDPGEPPHRGWRKGAAAVSVLLAAAAAAIFAAARNRKARSAPADNEEGAPAGDEAKASPDGEVKDTARTS